MKLSSWLSFIAAVFFVTPLAAQQNLPKSTQEHFAASARVEALTLGDLKTVLSKAQSGDCEPQYLLGLIYERGLLVPRDFSATKSWMLKSAEQGYVPAQEAMGEMYLINVRDNGPIRDYGDADRWLRLAATQGNADAQFWLGTGYERGWFGTIDYREALKWLRKAADQGLPNAQLSLGQMYEDGEGVRESDSLGGQLVPEGGGPLFWRGRGLGSGSSVGLSVSGWSLGEGLHPSVHVVRNRQLFCGPSR